MSSYILRAESVPLGRNQMTKSQRDVHDDLLKMFVNAVDLLDHTPSAIRNSYVPYTEGGRHNRISFMHGGRGSGKTSLVATMMYRTFRELHEPGVNTNLPPSFKASDIDKLRRVVWLNWLDLDPLPSQSHLIAAIVARVRDVIERAGPRRNGHQGTALDAIDQFQTTGVIGWTPNVWDRRSNLSPELYAIEVNQSERLKMHLNRDLSSMLDSVSDHLSKQSKRLFVLPIDDFDLNPALAVEVLKIIRMMTVPQLFTVVLGDLDIAAKVIRLMTDGQLSSLTPQREKLPEDIGGTVGEITINALRKLAAPRQRLELRSPGLDWAFWYRSPSWQPPGKKTDEEVRRLVEQQMGNISASERERIKVVVIDSWQMESSNAMPREDDTVAAETKYDADTREHSCGDATLAKRLDAIDVEVLGGVYGDSNDKRIAITLYDMLDDRGPRWISRDDRGARIHLGGRALAAPLRHLNDLWLQLGHLKEQLAEQRRLFRAELDEMLGYLDPDIARSIQQKFDEGEGARASIPGLARAYCDAESEGYEYYQIMRMASRLNLMISYAKRVIPLLTDNLPEDREDCDDEPVTGGRSQSGKIKTCAELRDEGYQEVIKELWDQAKKLGDKIVSAKFSEMATGAKELNLSYLVPKNLVIEFNEALAVVVASGNLKGFDVFMGDCWGPLCQWAERISDELEFVKRKSPGETMKRGESPLHTRNVFRRWRHARSCYGRHLRESNYLACEFFAKGYFNTIEEDPVLSVADRQLLQVNVTVDERQQELQIECKGTRLEGQLGHDFELDFVDDNSKIPLLLMAHRVTGMKLQVEQLNSGAWHSTSERTLGAFAIVHDLVRYYDHGTVRPILDHTIGKRAFARWKFQALTIEVPWFADIWDTFWELGQFLAIWNTAKTRVRREFDDPTYMDRSDLTMFLALGWIVAGLHVLLMPEGRFGRQTWLPSTAGDVEEKALRAELETLAEPFSSRAGSKWRDKDAPDDDESSARTKKNNVNDLTNWWQQLPEPIARLVKEYHLRVTGRADSRRTQLIKKWFIGLFSLLTPECGIFVNSIKGKSEPSEMLEVEKIYQIVDSAIYSGAFDSVRHAVRERRMARVEQHLSHDLVRCLLYPAGFPDGSTTSPILSELLKQSKNHPANRRCLWKLDDKFPIADPPGSGGNSPAGGSSPSNPPSAGGGTKGSPKSDSPAKGQKSSSPAKGWKPSSPAKGRSAGKSVSSPVDESNTVNKDTEA